MALDKEARIENVKYSIERYLNDNLGSTYTFDWEGAPFETTGVEEWIQERVMGLGGGDYHRGVSTTQDGQTVPVLLSLNIFVNKEKTVKTNRHYEIRDDVYNYLKIGSQINFYDFASGNTSAVVQIMKVREIITDSPIPDEQFYQYNLTVSIDWLQKW
jgi:hypothetical protein